MPAGQGTRDPATTRATRGPADPYAVPPTVAGEGSAAGADTIGGRYAVVRREALAAAGLDHPNIVPVHDAGTHEGRPFFTMAFVDGETLAARVRDRGPMSLDEAVRVMLPVVEAVAYAHARQIAHRDLKPENVQLAAAGSG